MQKVEFHELEEGDWGAVHFLSPVLREQLRKLKRGDIFRIIHLGIIADIGPTGRSVREAFITDPAVAGDASEYKAFWGTEATTHRH